MSFRVILTVTNNNPNTVYNKLKEKLGREPTSAELKDDVKRIRSEALVDMASQGKLRYQHKQA